ncbi:hypothetical protein ABLE93_25460 [Xanthobacter sp. KR7-65]|uniref:hypothetical protein n=1 Tax=Xanthobacter sp. KR7-65 TaxID=3156612 RepID=UPI0032B38DFD
MRRAFPIIAMLIMTSNAQAQNNCAKALIQDKTRIDVHDVSTLAALRLLQQSSTKSSGWSGSINVPISGVPVGIGANSAEDVTNDYFSKSTINWTRDRLESVATQTLSQNAADAYKTCIRGQLPLSIIVSDAKDDALTVTVKFIVPSNSIKSANGQVSISGGKPLVDFPKKWSPGESNSAIIKRDKNSDFRIVANVGGFTDSALVAFIPPPPVFAKIPLKKNPLFVGLTPNVNEGEIADHVNHKNALNNQYGFTIEKDDDFSGEAIFVGETPNLNASIVNTGASGWRGGKTKPIGYVIKPGRNSPSDLPLYVGVAPARCVGAVSNNAGHQKCEMKLLGYALQPQ